MSDGATFQTLRDPATIAAQQANEMTAFASTNIAALGQALEGAGAESLAAYQNLKTTTDALATLGKGAADAIDALNADESKPLEFRRAESFRMRQAADNAMGKMQKLLQPQVEQLDASLQAAMIPRPHVDTGQRMLIRDEIRAALGAKLDVDSARAYLKTASPHHAAELLGDYGRSLFGGQGQAHVFAGFRQYGIESLIAAKGGTDRQQAARRALGEFRGRKIAGQVNGIHTAARMHLRRHEGIHTEPLLNR
jgi:hypothetical protein